MCGTDVLGRSEIGTTHVQSGNRAFTVLLPMSLDHTPASFCGLMQPTINTSCVRPSRLRALRRTVGLTAACVATAVGDVAGQAAIPTTDSVLLVRAGRLFDSERGALLPRRDVLVRGGLVVALGERLEPPAGARVIDLSAYTVLPGLIDAHAHLLTEHPGDEGSGETIVRETVREGDVLRALRGAARARTYLEAGFTTVRDLGNAGQFADVALKRAIAEGSVAGPRFYVAGPGLAPEGGQAEGIDIRHRALVDEEYRIVRGPDDARQAVRENVTRGADVIKLYSNSSPNPAYLSVAEMRTAVEEAHLMGIRVSAHATTDLAVWRAVEAGVDAVEHPRGAADSTLAFARRRGVAIVLTEWGRELASMQIARLPAFIRPTEARVNAALEEGYDRVRRTARVSNVVAFGSDVYVDFGVPRGVAVRKALAAFAEAGLPMPRVLQAATSAAGTVIGDPRVGVIKIGAYADLIAVHPPPQAVRRQRGRTTAPGGGHPRAGSARRIPVRAGPQRKPCLRTIAQSPTPCPAPAGIVARATV